MTQIYVIILFDVYLRHKLFEKDNMNFIPGNHGFIYKKLCRD
jgi:hypothetical protein